MNPDVTEWWLIRHAPVSNPDQIVYGSLDMDIEPPSEDHFHALSSSLPENPVWMVSNLSRTWRTLEGILKVRGASDAKIHQEGDFAEQYLGGWEGRPRDEVWDDIRRSGGSWPDNIRPPNGETFPSVASRVATAAEKWSEQFSGRPIVAVLHAGSIRGFLSAAMGNDTGGALSFVIDNLSVTRCDHIRKKGWRVMFVNQRIEPQRR